eukprot:3681927-Pyramimonas_sp.AAC.1
MLMSRAATTTCHHAGIFIGQAPISTPCRSAASFSICNICHLAGEHSDGAALLFDLLLVADRVLLNGVQDDIVVCNVFVNAGHGHVQLVHDGLLRVAD